MNLEGEQIQITTASLKAHIGEWVRYLLNIDIDRSGRGYIFPRVGRIIEVYRQNVTFENGETVHFGDISEIVKPERK